MLIQFFQIALSCLHMACVILGKDVRQWFAELHVDFDKIQVGYNSLIQFSFLCIAKTRKL